MDKNTSYSEKDLVPIMEEVIQSGGSCKLKVTGYSMTPTLRHLKDSVVLVSPEKRQPKKNEIVFIKRDTGKHVLHRIRKIIDDQSFIMNGDAQQWTEVVRFNQVIGVVDSFYRGDKEVSCDNIKYKTYVKLWVLCKPIRPLIFKFRNLVRKVIK
ncbi:S24/S26 family peptidase [Intestinibacter sp.]|uniref:S24/S26 family peptidase n=3 Tax=Intestinibacter sp. TaxID=1965304 RepID=UPI002A74AC07|nr:S24/S26 family peptidase [Intestinibacter sp.]MDY2735567.1 S24/S26 family peptidase [Intestinibacter sp.]MDY4574512.1 S24/S26 family peptidase [Intestinibacter sp.]